jgi:hypothetical protein
MNLSKFQIGLLIVFGAVLVALTFLRFYPWQADVSGLWTADVATEAGTARISMLLIGRPDKLIVGTGGERTQVEARGFLISGEMVYPRIGLRWAWIDSDSSLFQGSFAGNDTLTGTIFGRRGSPRQVARFVRR